jgi:hypothetical protein
LADVKPQAALPGRLVDPVAVGAVLGEERLNLPLEVGASGQGREGDQAGQQGQDAGDWAFERMHGDTLGTVNIGNSRTNNR